MNENQPSIINVACGIIENDKKFLIAKRKKGKHLENKWEFPGGKIEQEETPEECLARELKEEFGVIVAVGNSVGESVFDYGSVKIRLLGYYTKYISGQFKLSDHDEIRWVSADEFGKFDFAEADLPIVKMLKTRRHDKTRKT